MSRTREKKKRLKRQAIREADRLSRDYPPEFLDVLMEVLAERTPRRRGRPEGSGEEDNRLLTQMADLILEDSDLSERAAAELVTEDLTEPLRGTVARRVRRKYAERREALIREAKRRADPDAEDKDLEAWADAQPFFAEDVEEWDLGQ